MLRSQRVQWSDLWLPFLDADVGERENAASGMVEGEGD